METLENFRKSMTKFLGKKDKKVTTRAFATRAKNSASNLKI